MEELLYDVIVVGGGPAGCTAAAELAAGGIDVLLFEKARVPRHKCCAGGVTRNTLALLPDGVAGLLGRQVRTMVVASLEGDSLTWECPEPFMYTASRAEVDAFLWRHAIAEGATATDDVEVTAVAVLEDQVVVTTPSRTLRARHVVAADGATGRIARILGCGHAGHRALGVALDVEGERIRPCVQEGSSKLILGLGPGIYGWVFAHANGSSIGLEAHWGVTSVDAKLSALLEFEGYAWKNVIRRCAHPITSLPGENGLGTGRVLLVGDAASLAHPLTGEGIRYAVLSGHLAAQAIISQPDNPLETYADSVRDEILPDLRAGMALLNLLSGRERFAIPLARHNSHVYDMLMNVLTGRSTFARTIDDFGGIGKLAAFIAGGDR